MKRFSSVFLLIILQVSFLRAGLSQELKSFVGANIDPYRDVLEVHQESVAENVYAVKNARVAIADYALIRKDFPALRTLSNEAIDNWLMEQVGYISKDHTGDSKVNTVIETVEGKSREAFRPPEYGRALVYEVEFEGKQLGVIDVKGAGGINPSHASHKSGTMTLGESFREFSYEKMISSVVDHSGIENKVVGAYAVIAPGFDVIHPDGSTSPAGFYLRQGHKRYTQAENSLRFGMPMGNGWMDKFWRERYDKLLTRYGIWANGNYQGTVENHLFDFGHYIVRDDLSHSLEAVAVPFEQWGFEKAPGEQIASWSDRWKFSKRDRPWNWSHETAEAFASGRASRHDVWLHHYNLLKPVQEKLDKSPRLYDFSAGLGFKVKACQQIFDIQGK